MLHLFINLAIGMSIGMTVLWVIQWIRHDAGIVDVGWSLGLLATAGYLMVQAPGDETRRLLAGSLAVVWSLRLGIYLFFNRVFGKDQEDGRYQRMREAMGRYDQPGFLLFFQVQAGFVLLFALPIYAATANPVEGLRVTDLLALLVGIGAILGESIADRQLAAHRADPDNRHTTCRRGLWRYSRHPNYFFEILHWGAYALFAVGSPLWWVGLLGPLVMLVFIWKITGVPYTEQQARSHREDYAEYQRTTSMIIPWPPKQTGDA